MARTNTLGNFLTDVANAIREKKGTSDTIQASNFDTEIVNLPSSDIDWSAIGYTSTPQAIINGYNYALEIMDNWTPTSSLARIFSGDLDLVYMPKVETSISSDFSNMFNGCTFLTKVEELDTSNGTNFSSMFANCMALVEIPVFDFSNARYSTSLTSVFSTASNKLSTNSLDNILQSCISATSFNGTKTLRNVGISSSRYSQEVIESLPHYQDFINAGWTTGY